MHLMPHDPANMLALITMSPLTRPCSEGCWSVKDERTIPPRFPAFSPVPNCPCSRSPDSCWPTLQCRGLVCDGKNSAATVIANELWRDTRALHKPFTFSQKSRCASNVHSVVLQGGCNFYLGALEYSNLTLDAQKSVRSRRHPPSSLEPACKRQEMELEVLLEDLQCRCAAGHDPAYLTCLTAFALPLRAAASQHNDQLLRRPRPTDAVERVAAYLAAQTRGFFGSVCGTAPAASHPLAAVLSHRWVAEGAPVFRQGAPGDSMYIILGGYCSVSRDAAPGDAASPRACASRTTTGGEPPPPPSRRATQERQQQLMIQGLANAGTRRGTWDSPAVADAAADGGMGPASDAAETAGSTFLLPIMEVPPTPRRTTGQPPYRLSPLDTATSCFARC
jgi:hypothetical protein